MKKIYLLNDYITSKNTLLKINDVLNKKYPDYEIISLDFSDYYEETKIEDINLKSLLSFFTSFLDKNINENDILIGIGLSSRFLTKYKNNERIYLNPLVYNNLFNVFCSSKKYFENNQDQFKIYLNKFIDLNFINFETEYEWYSKHYSKILKVTEIINLYDVLKSLKKEDVELFSNNFKVCLSLDDEIIDAMQLLKYLNSKSFKNISDFIFLISSEKHLEISENI